MTPTVLFVDGTCPFPYDPRVLLDRACGGTESTVVKIAEGLAKTGLFNVVVEQLNRTTDDCFSAHYCRPETTEQADYVICLRHTGLLRLMRERFPRAKLYLWSHDLATPVLGEALPEIVKSGCLANVVVSNYHKTQTTQMFIPVGYAGQFKTTVIYNPIADDLTPDDTPVEKNKLVFFSSPHKSLDYTLRLFANLRNFNSDFRLYVANPGYLDSPELKNEGVIVVGSLPQREALKHVRSSLCVFYPAVTWWETFGLVYAEANAVGTPVLGHPNGAAAEVLSHPYETLDCRNPKAVIDRVMSWYNGDRPRVRANEKFRLKNVLKQWMKLFDAS